MVVVAFSGMDREGAGGSAVISRLVILVIAIVFIHAIIRGWYGGF